MRRVWIVLLTVVAGCAVVQQHTRDAEGSLEVAPRLGVTTVTSSASWRDAAQTHDWTLVAQRIDALPEEQRHQPVARYARALAASRLGDCGVVLATLDGIGGQSPLLEAEVARLRAPCELDLGPFQAAAEYYEKIGAASALLDAALARQRAGNLERARELVERVLARARLPRSTRVRARALRADICERLGSSELAARDYQWLAVDAALPDADVAYERVAQRRLTKQERARRAQGFADRGEIERVLSELARVKEAPGERPSRVSLLRTEARGYYRARVDDVRAAQLFESAARLGGSVQDSFAAARAWTRAGEVDRARALYQRIARRDHSRAGAERASFNIGRVSFAHGRWAEAERAYTVYLQRYGGRRPGRHRDEALYERALSRLAAGRLAVAREDFGRLRRRGSRDYPASLLEYLEAVALVSSADAERRARGVDELQAIVRASPLSFVALASRARLERMGRPASRALAELPDRSMKGGLELRLPANVELFARLGLQGAAQRTLRQHERALRVEHAPRGTEALCRSYAAIGGGARSVSIAASLSKGLLGIGPSGDNLWAWQCLYPRPYERLVLQLEERHALPEGLVHAVMRQESSFHPNARSPVGATGLMQLMPGTAARAAAELHITHRPERLTDVRYNLELGTFYLGKLLSQFEHRPALALAAYNAGPHAVARWLRGSGDLSLDLWVARIPYDETRNYVMRVLASWARYRHLRGEGVPKLTLDTPASFALAASAY